MSDHGQGVATAEDGYEQPNPDTLSHADKLFWEMKSVSRFRKAVLVSLIVKYTVHEETRYAPISVEEAWSKKKPALLLILDAIVSSFVLLTIQRINSYN